MLTHGEENGVNSGSNGLRLLRARLKDARYILLAAVLVLAVSAAAGLLDLRAGLAALLAIIIAAALPRRSTTMRLAGTRQRAQAEMPWHRAVEVPLEALEDPVFLLRADGTVKFQNRAAVTLFGRAETDSHLSTRIRSPSILGLVAHSIAEDAPASGEHVERIPSERWLQVRCAPMPGMPGTGPQARLFLLTFRDMSAAKRMDRMRSDFVANASHELRTPLASLTGFIETIQGPAREDAAARDRFLAIMHEQAIRMTRLVDDLMSLSRLELKAHVAPTDRVDLVDLMRHVSEAMRPMADEYGVAIRFEEPSGPVAVPGDRDELIQVFENLIENACKYGQSGERIDLSLRVVATDPGSGPGGIEAVVRDYGPGIEAEHVPRLTERFYRVNVESSRSKRGTGLGLAIVKHILTRHRARLIVQSRPGEGSTFIVRFAAGGGETAA